MTPLPRPLSAQTGKPMHQPKVALSKATLRSLLRQVEQEILQGEIYQLAAAQLQAALNSETNSTRLNMDHDSCNPESVLKAVSREAIRLSLRQFAQQYNLVVRQSESVAQLPVAQTLGAGSAVTGSATSVEPTSLATARADEQPGDLDKVSVCQATSQGTTPSVSNLRSFGDRDAQDQLVNQVVVPKTAPIKDLDGGETPSLSGLGGDVVKPNVAAAAKPKNSGRSRGKVRLTRQQIEQAKRQQDWQQAVVKIGQLLKQRRAERSLCLEQLHNQSLVPIYQLRALEAGDLDTLPEEVYVRGFIRRICEVLDLDSQAMLSTLPAVDPNAGLTPSWKLSLRSDRMGTITATHLYLGYAALLVGSVSGLNWLNNQAESKTPASIWDGASADLLEQIVGSSQVNQPVSQSKVQTVAMPEVINPGR